MKFKKILGGLAMATTLLLTACGGTGGNGGTDGKRILKFEFLQAGLGLDVYKALAAAFEAEHPDVQVKLVPNIDINSTAQLNIRTNRNLSDVYSIRDVPIIKQLYIDGLVRNLDDIFASQITPTETFMDLIDPNALDHCTYEGELNGQTVSDYVCIPEYQNVSGFVFNKDLFDQYGWTIPTTTEEMEALFAKIKKDTGDKVKPIVWCGAAAQGYVYYLLNGMATSYEGLENMKKIFEFESAEIFNPVNQQGKRYALETFKDWFLESNGYTLKGSAGMGSIQAQNALIQGKAAMMLNGSWFRNEMKSYVGDTNLGIFKVPEKSIDGVVQHRDNKSTNNVVHSEYTASYLIPSKAKNVDDAVEFLKFISRPDMCELYTKTVDCVRPFKYNKDSSSDAYKDMNSFGKSVLDIADNNQLYVPVSKNPLAIRGQISYWPLNEDTYHTKRLLTEGRTVDYCLEREYAHAKTIL